MKGRTLFLGFFTLVIVGGAAVGVWFFFQNMQKKNLLQEAVGLEDPAQKVAKLKAFLETYPGDSEASQALAAAEKELETGRYQGVSAIEGLDERIEALRGFLKQYPDHAEAKEALAKAEAERKTRDAYRKLLEAANAKKGEASSAGTPQAWAEALGAAEAAVAVMDTEEARNLVSAAKGNRSWAEARVAEGEGDLDRALALSDGAAEFLVSNGELEQYRRSVREKGKAFKAALEKARAAEEARDWEAAQAAYKSAAKINPGNAAPAASLERIEDILRCMETLNAHFEIPQADQDQFGNPVTTREGARMDAVTGLPFEIWLKDPKMEFVLVPAGEVDAGGEKVAVQKAFYIGKYEVTNAQWKAVVKTHSFSFGEDGFPVVSVKWFQGKGFVDDLNKRVGEGEGRPFDFRLPTEPQWEFASRAGATTAFSHGDDEGGLGEVAWISANAEGKLHPVGKKKPNIWGLYDMQGNVWEWCDSDKGGISQPVRGGSFEDDAQACRCGHRIAQNPRWESKNLGVRLGLELNIELPK